MQKRLLSGNFSLDIAKAIENKITPSEDKKSKKRFIEGYMTTPAVDLENEITDPKAYPNAVDEIVQKAQEGIPIPIFIEHRRKEISLPIGSIISAESKPGGIWFKGEIAYGKIADPVWELIEQGVLRGCSMGGDALETSPDFDTASNREIRRIKKMTIRELSLTGLPVNPQAVFSMAKSLNIDERQVTTKLGKLEKAIEIEVATSALEKAVDEAKGGKSGLDDDSTKRIKEALDGLEQLLGIKTEASAPAATVTSAPTQVAPAVEAPVPESQPNKSDDALTTILSKLDELLAQKKAEPTVPQPPKATEPKDTEPKFEGPTAVEKPIEEKPTEEPEEELKPKKEEGGENNMAKAKEEEVKDETLEEGEVKDEKGMTCKSCSTDFDMSDVDYEIEYCPKCGKAFSEEEEVEEEVPVEAVEDVDEFDLGDDLGEDEFVEMCKFVDEEDAPCDDEGDEEMAKNLEVLQKKPSDDSGYAVSTFKGKYVKPSTGKRTDMSDSTEHEHPKPFKPLETGVSDTKFQNYGKDRQKSLNSTQIQGMIQKAVKDAVEDVVASSLEKALAPSGRRSIVPNADKHPIQKSEETPEVDADRMFAHALTSGMSDPTPME